MTRSALALLLLTLCALADRAPFVGTWKSEKVTLVLQEGAGQGLVGTVQLGAKSFALTASVDASGALAGSFQTPEGQSFAFTATLRAGSLLFKTGKNEFLLSKPAGNPFDDLPDDPTPPLPPPPPPAPPPAPPPGPPTAATGGVGIALYTDDKGQLVVQDLAPNGPAAKAGVQQGDIVLAIDGQPIPNGTLASQVTALRGPVGSRVKLTVQRGGARLDLTLVREIMGGPAPADAGYRHPSGLWRLVALPQGWERSATDDQNTVRWKHSSGALAFVTIIPDAPYRDGEEFFRTALGPGMQQAGAKFTNGQTFRPQGGPPIYVTEFQRTRENVPESGRLLAVVLEGRVLLLQTCAPVAEAQRLSADLETFHASFRLGAAAPPMEQPPPAPPGPPGPGPDADRAIAEAEEALDNEQYERALNLLSPLAAKDDPRAMFLLAYMLREGLGVRQAPAEAFKLYRRAAQVGFHPGMNLLGVCYRDGMGTPQDFAEAMNWFKKSALLGNRDAALSVGALYVNGQGVPADYVEGYAWYIVSDVEMAQQNMQQLEQYLSQQQIRQAQQRAQQIAATIKPEGGAPGGFPAQIMRTDDGRYVIQGIRAGSNAEKAGVRPGDVLITVGGKRVTGIEPAQLGALLEGAAGAILQMEVERNGQMVQLAFPRDAVGQR